MRLVIREWGEGSRPDAGPLCHSPGTGSPRRELGALITEEEPTAPGGSVVGQPHEATWRRSQGLSPGPGPRPHPVCTQPPGCADGSAVSPGDKEDWGGPGPHIRGGQGREVNTDPLPPPCPPLRACRNRKLCQGLCSPETYPIVGGATGHSGHGTACQEDWSAGTMVSVGGCVDPISFLLAPASVAV